MTDPNISTELDPDGILLARIDMPERAMNVFSHALMDSLEQLIERTERDETVRAVVLTSGKPSFLAGADLEMIQRFTEMARSSSTTECHSVFGRLGRLFRRLECAPKPFVAAINGLALGGGLELCLACHARIVVDEPEIQLGLPEVKLGLLPGAGGTQRLPRLIGTAKGLEMLLTGRSVSPREALALGLVDEAVPREALVQSAKRRALSIQAPVAPWDAPGAQFSEAPFDFSDPAEASAQITAAVGIPDETLRRYPAYQAIIDCVIGGWGLPLSEGGSHEMDIFVQLMRNPVAGNMVRALFLNRQKAVKRGLFKPDSVLLQGDNALLPRLRQVQERARALNCNTDLELLAIALAAVAAWDEDKVSDPDLADAVIVAEQLHPAYTGGPFTYASQCGGDSLRERASAAAAVDPSLFAVPPGLTRFLRDRELAAA